MPVFNIIVLCTNVTVYMTTDNFISVNLSVFTLIGFKLIKTTLLIYIHS